MAVAPALYATAWGSSAAGAEAGGATTAGADVTTTGAAVFTGAAADVATTGGAVGCLVTCGTAVVTGAAVVTGTALAWFAVGLALAPEPEESQLLAPSNTGAATAPRRVIVQRLTPRSSQHRSQPAIASRPEGGTPQPHM
jgi:hypothetical protein